MRIVIVEESHNRVAWQSRTPVLWIEAGLLAGAVSVGVLLLSSPSPMRWQLTGAVVAVLISIAAVLGLTTAPLERGHLERLPEGGSLVRTKVWPLVKARTIVEADLEGVTGFEIETEAFEESLAECYILSRLWALTGGGDRYCLTEWAETGSVKALGAALAKAGRRTLDGVTV
jgi:hypothetical protein